LIIAIHQPHYFPWLGYLDKMASADLFVILDDVQMNIHSPIRRNKFLETNGKMTQLAVSIEGSGFQPIKHTGVSYQSKWNGKHMNFLLSNYKKHKYFNQIWPHIENIFNDESENIFDLDMKTVFALREFFNIKKPLIYQSDLNYDRTAQKNELIISILKNIADLLTSDGGGGLIYLSGQGAKKYMILDDFIQEGIEVRFQEFVSPVYSQKNSKEFVPNLSALDYLFNCGIEGAKDLFSQKSSR
jgi:hypothetical protein